MIWLEFEFYSQYSIETLKQKFNNYKERFKQKDKIEYVDIENERYSWMRELKISVKDRDVNTIKRFIKKINFKLGIMNWYTSFKRINNDWNGIRGIHLHIFNKDYKEIWDNILYKFDYIFFKYIDYKIKRINKILWKIDSISNKLLLTYFSEFNRLLCWHQILNNFFYRKDLYSEEEKEYWDEKIIIDERLENIFISNSINFKYWRTFWYDRPKYNPILIRSIPWLEPSIEFRFLDTTDLYNIPELYNMFKKEIEWIMNGEYKELDNYDILKYTKKIVNIENILQTEILKREFTYSTNYIYLNKILNENEKMIKE